MVCFFTELDGHAAKLSCVYVGLFILFLHLGGFSVFAGVGERTREGNDLYREMIESGVIKLGDKQVMIRILNVLLVLISVAGFPYIVLCGRVRASALLSTVK